MKKIVYILLSFTLVFASCEDIIEVEPTASFDAEQGVITTESRAELALSGMYDGFQSANYYGNYIITYGDLHTDNMDHTGTFVASKQIDLNEILPDNVLVAGIWDQIYYVINIANTIYAEVPNIDNIEQETSDRMQGEALFVRALSYLNLVKNWGGVPLQVLPIVTTEDIERSTRATEAAVYTQIENDLIEAITKLGDYSVDGRANAWAARAILSRAYLYQGEYQNAYNYAYEVIENGPYTITGSYADIFDFTTPYSSESIFEVDNTSQDGNSLAFWYWPDDLGGRYEFGVSADLEAAYDAADLRYAASIGFYSATGEYYITKFQDVASGSDNIIVVRLSEMYLTRAEALVMGASPTGADTRLSDFNVTYTRAGLTAFAGTLTQDMILDERRFEFAFEGHRWYDLKRTGNAISVIPNVISTDDYLWPIPQDERDVNPNLEQNPGY